ncbi:replicative DNA helicase [Cryobacterium fucosi]|uniref:DNA 5'-3' helicase n=1 Tax=Cryobacterium fucosi TaxID=1259157 RepID=A0A4R9B2Q7_9MICO|nr:replicative DNA helicase [Cryobacterium fucosi]TFD74715.1 replicative DNA helicase [Cryobacterium fucosi]
MSDQETLPEHAAATLQHDRFAEQSVLGSMMLDVRAVWDVIAICAPTDFHDWRHEDIARTIVGLAHRNEPTEPISVIAELTKLGLLDRVGGVSYVFELQGVPSVWSTVAHYAQIVLEASLRRGLLAAGNEITQLGKVGVGDVFEQVEAARALVDQVTRSAKVDVKPIGDTFAKMIESLTEPPTFVETPWRDLNDFIGGLRPGKLYVIGARPGSGKSIVGLQIAVRLAQVGNVAFASLEMSEEDLQKRMLALFGEVHMTALMNSSLSPEDWEKVAKVRTRVMGAPIYIDDRPAMNITQIKAFARSTARKGKLAGVVVDYLQLMTDRGGDKARHEVVGEFSRELKILARELEVPVIALSQLNRALEKRTSGKPSLSDLRESGAIEQDADAVMLLHREDANPKRRHLVEVIVAKNRHGKTGTLELLWEGQYARVQQRSTVWTPTTVIEDQTLI